MRTSTPRDLAPQARAAADAAQAEARRAERRADLLSHGRLAYGPLDDDRTVYLAAAHGQELGELRPDRPGAAICSWYAYPKDRPNERLGPFSLGRQAAAALYRTTAGK